MINKNIFITGATGFIGRHLALKLAEKNKVFALVRPQSIENTLDLKRRGIEIILGDLLDANFYSQKLNNIDYVFHLAALFKLDASKEELYRHNVLGTKRLLESCLDKNIQKIIYFSTAYLAGTKEKEYITEEESYPERFKNWYEWSKAEGEKAALNLFRKYNLPIVVVRPVIVFGPGSTYGFYNALSLIAKGKLWLLPGNGKNKVHLVYVEDVVNATIHLAQLERNSGEIYHICDDHPHSCFRLIRILCQNLNRKPPLMTSPRYLVKLITRLPIWKLLFKDVAVELIDYFIYNQSYTNTKLKTTGFHLDYPSLNSGLQATINWYYENGLLTKS